MENQINPQSSGVDKKTEILHQFDQGSQKNNWRSVVLPALVILLIILAGSVTGYFLANKNVSFLENKTSTGENKKSKNGSEEMGIKDEKQFPDKAQGKIGINDSEAITEGSHKLIRPHGESQTAYLTSSAVDLGQYLGECVEVWGKTYAAKKAAWLMDVGYITKIDKCPEGL